MIDLKRFEQSINFLDEFQKEAIYCDTNCVVTAGAGSGKTTVLSNRFLYLVLSQQAHADEILTLTFTRLAATQMFEKIEEKLRLYEDEPLIHQELLNLAEATITTIDSFCYRVVSSDPLRYGLSPTFEMDDQLNKELAEEVAFEVCRQFKDHPGFLFLSSLYSPETLITDLFVEMATKEFYLSSSFDKTHLSTSLISSLESIARNSLSQLDQMVMFLSSVEGNEKTLETNKPLFEHYLTHRDEILQFTNYPLMTQAIEPLMKMHKARSKSDYKDQYNEYAEVIRSTLVGPLVSSLIGLNDTSSLESAFDVFELLRELYLKRKKEKGVLSFKDVAHMAHDILISHTNLRRYYQQKFRFIMIDEFQDTDLLQKEILFLLAQKEGLDVQGVPSAKEIEHDKLFFVGDQKQSIYRFRGADVSVFNALLDEVELSGGKRINLATNYRSEQQLVHFYNNVFEPIMGDAEHLYEAEFEPLKAKQSPSSVTTRIEYHLKEKTKEREDHLASDTQSEAVHLANTISKMVEGDDYLIANEDGTLRRPTYQDIAVLYRSTTNQMHYEKALRLKGIPYNVSTIQSLFLEAPLNDIVHFLELVIHNDDRLSFATVLRSPFCHLSDDALLELTESGINPFEQYDNTHWESEDIIKYQQVVDVYHQLSLLAQSESISTLIDFLFNEGGYKYYLLRHSLYHPYIEHFDYIYELAIQFDQKGKSLVDFLAYVRPLLGKRERLDEVEPLQADLPGVRLLTIHKSKGLEFPIVIVASMGTSVRPLVTPSYDYEGGLLSFNYTPYKTPVRNLFYEAQKEEIRDKELAELKRLFYVALTRAQHHLLFMGVGDDSKIKEEHRGTTFFNLLGYYTNAFNEASSLTSHMKIVDIPTSYESDLFISVSHNEVSSHLKQMEEIYAHPKEQLSITHDVYGVTEWINTYIPPESEQEAIPLPTLPSDEIINRLGFEALFGTWTHAALEWVINHYGSSLSDVSIDESTALSLIPSELEHLGLSQKEKKVLVSGVISLVENFTHSHVLHSLLQARPRVIESEIPFSLRHNHQGSEIILNGVIDLLIRYDSHIEIIDFKTDATIEKERHHTQLALYQEAAHKLYDQKVNTRVCYLRSVDR
ncbi:MAG: UvrD-helicase domain-containing protein [Sphaerochaetaceae bacterium]|jgi:ATP-dependent exoDNAse (exonuclease V) beta subunit